MSLEHGGPSLGATWIGAGAIENGARRLFSQVAHVETKVPLVPRCGSFGKALVPVEETSEPFLLNAS
ncbi:hypothetical protein AMTR_s00004p00244560 [Amborella trichopoda]|uniref:Uncharacterized protein n=1 Tax=Amborella trichopoda TaxID=13333 RepID=W1NDL2_AMBTC|nr:hypothetical protein AMTR_s00004p00244560 [Amborella trichopoda]